MYLVQIFDQIINFCLPIKYFLMNITGRGILLLEYIMCTGNAPDNACKLSENKSKLYLQFTFVHKIISKFTLVTIGIYSMIRTN
jgi:hypothetical protein